MPSGTPLLTLDESQILDVPKRVMSPDIERGIPAWRVNVNYGMVYTVQKATDVAGSAQTALAVVSNRYRTATVSDVTVKQNYTNPPEVNVDTDLATLADATTFANYLLNLYKVRRDVFVVRCAIEIIEPMLHTYGGYINIAGPELGSIVQLTSSRFGLGAGKLYCLLGVQMNLADQTAELTLWG